MKKIIIAALAAAAIGTTSAATYKVDEYHANARFAIDHFNTSTNVGGFYGLTGSSANASPSNKTKRAGRRLSTC
ncbi:putative exported protein, partial [Neisseria meningitidis M13265]